MNSNLISTRDEQKKKVTYSKALLNGLADDGGLYVLGNYPKFSILDLKKFQKLSYIDLVFEIKKKLVGNFAPEVELKKLISNAYSSSKFNFKNNLNENLSIVPITKIDENLYLQNLSQGPTAAFKDMAMQLLAREINFELNKIDETLLILGATSGDTGPAGESAIKNLNRIKLFMLSPKFGMSKFQKAQMGNLSGGNIFNISIDGRFDDCQKLVKKLKKESEFSKLGAINSINWGRITAQIPYFFSGYLQTVKNIGEKVDFVVPSGNFGNILSAYIAKQMGLPIRKLIIATNENNVLEKLINTGIYELKPAKITSSPSMDISKASNYERLLFDILNKDAKLVKKYLNEFKLNGKVDIKDYGIKNDVFKKIGIYAKSSNHINRIETIKKVYNKSKIIIDPHTADGVYVAKQFKKDDQIKMIVMQTALCVKFENIIKEAIGFIPKREKQFENIEELSNENSFENILNNLDELKKYIKNNI